MKILRFEYEGSIFWGVLDSGEIRFVEGDIFGDFKMTDSKIEPEEVSLKAPVIPPNIIAVGLNYRQHAQESGMDFPEEPVLFLKATSAVIASGEDIVLPQMAPDEVDFEAELAVVIGEKTRNVSVERALDCVLGYTCSNDVSARDCQIELDVQWARGKSFDTFAPLGPWIETDLDPDRCQIKSRVNGEVMQDSNTSDMIFSTAELVSYISRNMTLLPGTVIMTGTPEGVGFARRPPVFLRSGDTVEIEIEGIGVLRNEVIREKSC